VKLVFECRPTVIHRIQEALRAERATARETVAQVISRLSPLLPSSRELSASLLIEPTDLSRMAQELEAFRDLDLAGQLYFEFGPGEIAPVLLAAAVPAADLPPMARRIRVPLNEEQGGRLRDSSRPVFVVLIRPERRIRVEVPKELRLALADDLAAR
jgi:hypothetical protein